MDYQEFLSEVKNPEKEKVELKIGFTQWAEIAETIAAFSTSKGGKLFVGVDRNGIPVGVFCDNEIKGKLHNLAQTEIKPPATISLEIIPHEKDKVIVVIDVQKGNDVFSYKGVHYQRKGDSNFSMTADEIFQIQKDIKKLYFDELPAKSETRPALISDIDDEKIYRNYIFQVDPPYNKIETKRFLSNHNLLVNGGIEVKNAAIMLFGRDPQKFLPQLKISLSVFPSNTITTDFSKEEYVGDLFKMLNDAYVGIRRNIKVHSFTEGLKRYDVPTYPLDAIREVLINALIHRDYFDQTTETFVKIFIDRIEVLNPASFPVDNFSFEEIRASGLSKRRNPIIATFFTETGMMEQEGRGLILIQDLMKKHGLPDPLFEVTEHTFKVILRSPPNLEAIKHSPYGRVADFENLNEREQKFIEHMKVHGNRPISRSEYVSITGADERTASRDLNDLQQRKIVKREGETKGARYFLLLP